ncbi:TetR/AcrR family transcriptional regulator [Desulfoluna sp.]|uniref:TetR/AcrR family transcriptional regulator n=1 Tax=Desulfoluna sp. TaxID=2045199 RepID=UPI00261F0B09|nr:TetR/AcrR family transcriptional regulator [Desulfoluna sp.]
MRPKDESKREAILNSAMVLINTYGLAHTSMSKIAREAGVSPATIYIYFENKDHLLITLYVEVKREMSRAILDSLDDDLEIRDAFRLMWENLYAYYLAYPDHFVFAEQFCNAPIVDAVEKEDAEGFFAPFTHLIERGQDAGVLKPVSLDLLLAFAFHPLTQLAKQHVKEGTAMDDEGLEAAFSCAWDAVAIS